jgi:hypothetical protein
MWRMTTTAAADSFLPVAQARLLTPFIHSLTLSTLFDYYYYYYYYQQVSKSARVRWDKAFPTRWAWPLPNVTWRPNSTRATSFQSLIIIPM